MNITNPAPVIDCHVHLYGPQSDQGVDPMLELCNLSAMNLACVPFFYEKAMVEIPYALLLKLQHPGRIYVSGGLMHNLENYTLTEVDFAAQARILMSAGCDGIKMLEGKPTCYRQFGVPMTDPCYDEYYALLEAEQIPVIFHVADPPDFWDAEKINPANRKRGWYYGEGGYPSKQQLHDEVDDILLRFPNLRFTLAHFYFYHDDVERATAFLAAHPTVSFDLTPCIEMYRDFALAPAQWREFFIRFSGQILLGTDHILTTDKEYQKAMGDKIAAIRKFLETDGVFEEMGFPLEGLGLPADALEKIYRTNFQDRFGATPTSVNVPVALEICDQLISDLKRNNFNPEVITHAKAIRQDISNFA